MFTSSPITGRGVFAFCRVLSNGGQTADESDEIPKIFDAAMDAVQKGQGVGNGFVTLS